MRLLIPIFKQLPIEGGVGIRNIGLLKKFSQQPSLIVKIWKNLDILHQKTIPFQGMTARQIFLSDHFSADQISSGGLATIEFDQTSLSDVEKQKMFSQLFETQLALRSKNQKNWGSVLYDLVLDRKAGHKFSPILHSAHTAYITPDIETFAVFMNFRAPATAPSSTNQKMNLEVKSADGHLLGTKVLSLPFNDTAEISFSNEFQPYGGYHNGAQLNFKGGESQFAIFTLFFNKKTESFGIEHSLPPIYYCSAIYEPQNRVTFFKNALKGLT